MSTAKFSTWLNPDGTENYKCRAWVNFNGTGTVVIRASGNVSSITDNGVGDYTVNFATAMPDANYCPQVYATAFGGGSVRLGTVMAMTSTAFRFQTVDGAGGLADWAYDNVSFFR